MADDTADTAIIMTGRTEAEKERDYPLIARYYVHGESLSTILAAVNTNYPPERQLAYIDVKNDLLTIRKAWLESSLADFNELKAIQLARLDEIENQLWQVWEKSQGKQVSTEIEHIKNQVPMPGGTVVDVEMTRKKRSTSNRYGDHWIMASILKIQELRARILGLLERDQRFIVDWRTEAQTAGFSPEQAEQVKQSIAQAILRNIMESGGKPEDTILEGEFIPIQEDNDV